MEKFENLPVKPAKVDDFKKASSENFKFDSDLAEFEKTGKAKIESEDSLLAGLELAEAVRECHRIVSYLEEEKLASENKERAQEAEHLFKEKLKYFIKSMDLIEQADLGEVPEGFFQELAQAVHEFYILRVRFFSESVFADVAEEKIHNLKASGTLH